MAEYGRKHDQEILGFLLDKNSMCILWKSKIQMKSWALGPSHWNSSKGVHQIKNGWESESKNPSFVGEPLIILEYKLSFWKYIFE